MLPKSYLRQYGNSSCDFSLHAWHKQIWTMSKDWQTPNALCQVWPYFENQQWKSAKEASSFKAFTKCTVIKTCEKCCCHRNFYIQGQIAEKNIFFVAKNQKMCWQGGEGVWEEFLSTQHDNSNRACRSLFFKWDLIIFNLDSPFFSTCMANFLVAVFLPA